MPQAAAPPFKILIDTCVWIDLAKNYQQQPVLTALEALIYSGEVEPVLPRIVVEEFARNKARIVEESARSLSSTLKRVKDVIDRFGDPRKKRAVLRELNDVDHRLPTLGSAAAHTVNQIEDLFSRIPVTEVTDAVKLRAVQRAMDRRAPFHRQRNGINDAILIEMYADLMAPGASPPRTRFAFVTHNTKDFSHPSAHNAIPHPDIEAYFTKVRSLYFTTLGGALRRLKPEQFAYLMIEQDWNDEPRRLPEILAAIDELVTKVWYNRHQVLRERVESGAIEIIEEYDPARHSTTIARKIWKGAREAAAKVEKEYGLENLGPWDDFEWGMLNGKLSALRWVLGDEWDMLDT